MKRAPLLLIVLATGCPDSHTNPAVLWLAPDQAETRVKLVDSEPNTY